MVTFKFPMCVFDESAHTEEEFNAAQDAIAKVSPFSKHRLSVELMRLGDHGTAIFIWDLEKKGNVALPSTMKHEMEWLADDIQLVDKKKLRRPGNFAKTVPSDWCVGGPAWRVCVSAPLPARPRAHGAPPLSPRPPGAPQCFCH